MDEDDLSVIKPRDNRGIATNSSAWFVTSSRSSVVMLLQVTKTLDMDDDMLWARAGERSIIPKAGCTRS